MDTTTPIASEQRDSQSVSIHHDQELRAHWVMSKSIPAIALAIDASPRYLRARAVVLRLKPRPRLSLTG